MRRGLFFADGYFPFPVPIVPIWDGETFFEDAIFGVKGKRKRPSANAGSYRLVCGAKTSFPIGPLSLEEASWMYWRVAEWRILENLMTSSSASETYFGITPDVPSLAGESISGLIDPEWMREPILTTAPFRFIGHSAPVKTWYFSLESTTPGEAEYHVGWNFETESYQRFESPPDDEHPAYPANGGLWAQHRFRFENTIRFVRTASGDYYASLPYRGHLYCTSAMPSGAPLADGLNVALGNSAVISSPVYAHQVILDVYDSDTESTFQEFLDLPAETPPQVEVLEGRNLGLGLEYGALRRIVYLADSDFSIELPGRTLTVPLYNQFSQAANFYDEWDGATQTLTPPPTVTLAAKQFWPYGGIYDKDTGARV